MFQSPSLRGSGRFPTPLDEAAFLRLARFNPLHCGAVVASGRLRHRLARAGRVFQSPSLRGSGRFDVTMVTIKLAANWFQSPSLRGSGRFYGGARWLWRSRRGFNPLHCGAVVASRLRKKLTKCESDVSIPFIAGQWSLLDHGRGAGRRLRAWSQSPSLRGSGRFIEKAEFDAGALLKSQSPSLRGSGRFGRRSAGCPPRPGRLNPLHCGAVVASRRQRAPRRKRAHVSIPFIAGQWSLRRAARGAPWREHRLNPLHCGAVVASIGHPRGSGPGRVSIPFIAGQWSLRTPSPPRRGGRSVSQSPSLRGSGRFSCRRCSSPPLRSSQSPSLRGSGRFKNPRRTAGREGPPRLNPLHCGAVVASIRRPCWEPKRVQVSIPFIAGQWSLQGGKHNGSRLDRVSIPFIAGQWSLPPGYDRRLQWHIRGLNPLHCGAVVASKGARRGSATTSPSFNPLHCGAVVASPFRAHVPGTRLGCFNPLHCGAVVASRPCLYPGDRSYHVSIPFIAGQWSLLRGVIYFNMVNPVSIPFIAGQWSLHNRARRAALHPTGVFQSPSLRGSGRFLYPAMRRNIETIVSIPFIAGQWSLPERGSVHGHR